MCIEDLRALGLEPVVCTDDGSLGEKGHVTDILRRFLERHPVSFRDIYACGPRDMLRELGMIARGYRLKGYVSLEENMACGIGACLGCVVNTRDGLRRVCRDGPVFRIEEIYG